MTPVQCAFLLSTLHAPGMISSICQQGRVQQHIVQHRLAETDGLHAIDTSSLLCRLACAFCILLLLWRLFEPERAHAWPASAVRCFQQTLLELGSRCHHTLGSPFLQDLDKLASPGVVLHKDSVTLQSDLKGLDQVKNYYRVSARLVCREAQGAWQGV